MSRTNYWLVCYDVTCQRRLGRVRRFLVRRARPLQYSVFLAQCDEAGLAELLAGLAERIDARCDDVRLYPLARGTVLDEQGRSAAAQGIHFLPDPFKSGLDQDGRDGSD